MKITGRSDFLTLVEQLPTTLVVAERVFGDMTESASSLMPQCFRRTAPLLVEQREDT
jgi:hypothetical protein